MSAPYVIFPPVDIAPGVVKGRNPREGTQRAYGLEFGLIKEQISNDPLFQKAVWASNNRSIIAPERAYNLYLIITQFLESLPSRTIIEFGSYRGGSALFMGVLLKEIFSGAKLFALTYGGMPKTDKNRDAHNHGDFSDHDFNGFQSRIKECGLEDTVIPVKGLFEKTFPSIAQNGPFALAHLDADIYSATVYAQNAVWPYMTTGGYVVYDDATVSSCLGATEAVEELIAEKHAHAEQIYPHFVFRAGL